MLTLTGTIRAVTTLGGGVNKKTGEVIPTRPVLQIEGLDNRGLVQLFTLTVVPDHGCRSEEHTSELQSPCNLVCRLLLEKKKKQKEQTSATDLSNVQMRKRVLVLVDPIRIVLVYSTTPARQYASSKLIRL